MNCSLSNVGSMRTISVNTSDISVFEKTPPRNGIEFMNIEIKFPVQRSISDTTWITLLKRKITNTWIDSLVYLYNYITFRKNCLPNNSVSLSVMVRVARIKTLSLSSYFDLMSNNSAENQAQKMWTHGELMKTSKCEAGTCEEMDMWTGARNLEWPQWSTEIDARLWRNSLQVQFIFNSYISHDHTFTLPMVIHDLVIKWVII